MLGPSIVGVGVPFAFAYSILTRLRRGPSTATSLGLLLAGLELAGVALVLVADVVSRA